MQIHMLRADASAAQRFRLAKISSVAIWARRQQKLQQPFDRNQLPQQQSEAPANAAVMSGQDKLDAAQDPPRGPCVPARRPIFLLTGLPTPRTPTKNPLAAGLVKVRKRIQNKAISRTAAPASQLFESTSCASRSVDPWCFSAWGMSGAFELIEETGDMSRQDHCVWVPSDRIPTL